MRRKGSEFMVNQDWMFVVRCLMLRVIMGRKLNVRRPACVALLVLGVAAFPLLSAAQSGCELKKDKDGIRVYTCDTVGLSIKKITSMFTVDVPVAELTEFVMDIENYVNWQYNTTQSSLLSRTSKSELLYYVKVKAPWPIGDRDMVIDQTVNQDPATKIVTITAISKPEGAPKTAGLIRVPMSAAKWVLHPMGGRVRIDYQVVLDPGGAISPWMVNLVSAQAPYESFKTLKEKIKQRKGIPRKYPFIVN